MTFVNGRSKGYARKKVLLRVVLLLASSQSRIIIDPKKTTKEKWKKDSKCLCRRYCNGGGNEQGNIGG